MSAFQQIGGLIVILVFMLGLMIFGSLIQYTRGWPFFRDAAGRQRFAFGKRRRR